MPYQADIIRGRKASVTDMQEGEYVINEFSGKVQGLLKLNGRLHATDFIAESNTADLKSNNELVVSDGVNDRVVIGDIGRTKDGTVFGKYAPTKEQVEAYKKEGCKVCGPDGKPVKASKKDA